MGGSFLGGQAHCLPKVESVGQFPVVLAVPDDFGFPDEEIPPYYSWPMKSHEPNAQLNIVYVIYRNQTVDEVKKAYRIDPEAEVDYRYIPYSEAVLVLDRKIKDARTIVEKYPSKLEQIDSDKVCINRDLHFAKEMLTNYYQSSYYLMKYLGS